MSAGRVLLCAMLACAAPFLPAQKGKGGGTPTTLLRPVIVIHANISSTTHDYANDPHMTLHGGQSNLHPSQLSPTSSEQGFIHSISSSGDLTHEGGARWVLDVRATVTGGVPAFNALIATPETIATDQNPTWYYLPAADDPVDRVLLDTASPYEPHRAKWAPRVVGGKIKIAFYGTGPIGTETKHGLFVGSVTWGASGPTGPLQDITLVAEGDPALWDWDWKWGTANLVVFKAPVGTSWEQPVMIADVSAIPAAPTIVATGILSRGCALSHDGRFLAYLAMSGTKELIHIRDLTTTATVVLPWPSGGESSGTRIHGLEWSPDDQFLSYTFRDFIGVSSVYTQRTSQPYRTKNIYVGGTQGKLGDPMQGRTLWRQ